MYLAHQFFDSLVMLRLDVVQLLALRDARCTGARPALLGRFANLLLRWLRIVSFLQLRKWGMLRFAHGLLLDADHFVVGVVCLQLSTAGT